MRATGSQNFTFNTWVLHTCVAYIVFFNSLLRTVQFLNNSILKNV